MKSNLTNTILSVLILMIASPLANADETGWYIGASMGNTSSDISGGDLSPACSTVLTCSADDSDGSTSIFGGYQFNRHLAAEAGYVDLGDSATLDSDNGGGLLTHTTQETTGIGVTGIGRYALSEQWAVLGKFGMFLWDSDINFSNILGAQLSASDSGTDLTYGLGANYRFDERLSLRLAWDRYTSLGNSGQALPPGATSIDTVDVDVDVYSVGLVYRFR